MRSRDIHRRTHIDAHLHALLPVYRESLPEHSDAHVTMLDDQFRRSTVPKTDRRCTCVYEIDR